MSLDSSPSTSENYDAKSCEICDQPGHGNHFGALTCRACSAFFRRAVLGHYINFRCLQSNGKCTTFANVRVMNIENNTHNRSLMNPAKFSRVFCKKCRLEKCLKAGMSSDKFQLGHDPISSSRGYIIASRRKKYELSRKIPFSMETFLGRPHFIISFDLQLASPIKTMIDLSFLVSRASDVLKEGIYINDSLDGLSALEKLTHGLSLVREPESTGVKCLSKVGKSDFFCFWENEFLAVARWLTYCDEYQQLPHTIKMELLKCVWFMWNRMEKILMTAEMRSKTGCKEGMLMFTHEVVMNLKDLDIDISWLTNYSLEQFAHYVDFFDSTWLDEIIEPLIALKTTPTEQTFMLFQLCFHFAGKMFQGNILEASERMIETLSNDLHNYYTKELKMPNYCGRLAQLLRINNIVKKDLMARMERKGIARLFDIFIIDFTHPEMFYGYKQI